MAKAKKKENNWWANRIVQYGEQPANQFLAHELNARRHPAKQRDALRGSLNAVGWVAPVIVSKRTGKIIDGHARVEEALSRDENSPVPFVEVEVSENEERTILATFDPITGLAIYEREALDALLREVDTGEAALQDMLSELAAREGLYLDEAGAMGDPSDAEPQIDRAAELNKKWKVKPGDLWLIGSHRLLCGDSTKAEDVARVLGGAKPNLMVTDPLYGVNLDQSWRDAALGEKALGAGNKNKVLNDARADWTEVWRLFEGDIAYIWHASKFSDVVMASLRNAQFEIVQQLIWNKTIFVMGRSDYHFKHEPCWYAVRKGRSHCWIGDRKQSTVIEAKSPNHIMAGSDEDKTPHPTQKPIDCFLMIRNHEGDVYEPFAGSGTTLVAAQNLNRRCYAIEISPDYCAVILERMSQAFPDLEVKRDA